METRYRVSQTFETLGDPCAEAAATREAAEVAAAVLRDVIADMVAGWATPDAGGDTGPDTGWANEVEAWNQAAAMADGQETYGRAVGEYIAEQAVTIEEIEAD